MSALPALIKPEEIVIKDMEGEERTFVISRIPASYAREIVLQYPKTAMNNYEQNEKILYKMLAYVAAINPAGEETRLKTRALIDNHVPDVDTLLQIEAKMMEYNTNFFKKGGLLGALNQLAVKSNPSNTQTQTNSAPLSSATTKPS